MASFWKGLVMKSKAPCCMAATAVSMVPKAVSTTTGSFSSTCLTAASTSRPSSSGILRSVTTSS